MRYPLILTLRPSRWALVLIAALHLVAAIAFVLSSLEPALRGLALLVLGVSLWRAVQNERNKAGRVLVLDDCGLLGFGAPGDEGAGRPLPGCADFGWAIWLQWQDAAASRAARLLPASLMLLPDNVPSATWRAVRAWLRHKAAAASIAPARGGEGP
jgi:hypothetical protein